MIVLIILVTSTFSYAVAVEPNHDDISQAQLDALGLDAAALPEELDNALAGYDYSNITLDGGVSLMLSYGSSQLGGLVRGAFAQAAVVVLIVLVCGFAETFMAAGGSSKLDVVPLVGTLAVASVVGVQFGSVAGGGRTAIEALFVFSKGLLASVAAATAAVGSPITAAGKYAANMMFSDLLISIIDRLLMPILYAYIAAVAAGAAIGDNSLERLAKFLKWICVGILGTLLTIFVAYLTVSGVISGGADAVTIKAAKSLLAGSIPVVGGIIGDAAETVLASARVVRNSAGLVGVFGVLAVCLVPFLQTGLQYLLFRAAGAASAPLAGGRISKLLDDLAGAFGVLTGMVGTCALLTLISVVSFMSVAGV